MCAVGLQPSVALQRASVVQYRRVRRETNRRMLSTLILILSVPDALQPRGPALSSLKPAELTTATTQPQTQLPLHPAFPNREQLFFCPRSLLSRFCSSFPFLL